MKDIQKVVVHKRCTESAVKLQLREMQAIVDVMPPINDEQK